eukprot:1149983-Pelagomonas_calceolata.AAC.2
MSLLEDHLGKNNPRKSKKRKDDVGSRITPYKVTMGLGTCNHGRLVAQLGGLCQPYTKKKK